MTAHALEWSLWGRQGRGKPRQLPSARLDSGTACALRTMLFWIIATSRKQIEEQGRPTRRVLMSAPAPCDAWPPAWPPFAVRTSPPDAVLIPVLSASRARQPDSSNWSTQLSAALSRLGTLPAPPNVAWMQAVAAMSARPAAARLGARLQPGPACSVCVRLAARSSLLQSLRAAPGGLAGGQVGSERQEGWVGSALARLTSPVPHCTLTHRSCRRCGRCRRLPAASSSAGQRRRPPPPPPSRRRSPPTCRRWRVRT